MILLSMTLFLFAASLEDMARLSERLARRTEYLSAVNRIGRAVVGRGIDEDFLSLVERECGRAIPDAVAAIGVLKSRVRGGLRQPEHSRGGLRAVNREICEYFAGECPREGSTVPRVGIGGGELAGARREDRVAGEVRNARWRDARHRVRSKDGGLDR